MGWGGVGKNHHSRMYAGLANLSEDGGVGGELPFRNVSRFGVF